MPARQRGFARRRGARWLATWREDGRERSRGGFDTKTDALDYANRKAGEAAEREAASRFNDPMPVAPPAISTVQELVDAFVARQESRVDPATVRTLRARLKYAVTAFGDRRVETLQPIELDVWRSSLPKLSAHYPFRALRQALEYAVAMELIDRNPTARIRNVRASADRREQRPFTSWGEVDAVAEEMDPRFAALPVVLVGTGLRPEELFALERRDVDLNGGVLSVERVYTQRMWKDCKKSSRQRRQVPLTGRVVDAIRAMPPRLDTPLLFPATRGGPIDLEKFRYRVWTPALRAAGVDHRRVYDTRHTFASWAIAAGVQLFHLARVMGTSVAQIDATYGHLLPDSLDYVRGLLDSYDNAAVAAQEGTR